MRGQELDGMLVSPNSLGQAAPGVARKGYSGTRQTGWETMLDILLLVLNIILGLGIWDRTWRLLKYIRKCLEAARDWVEECIRERKLKEP